MIWGGGGGKYENLISEASRVGFFGPERPGLGLLLIGGGGVAMGVCCAVET